MKGSNLEQEAKYLKVIGSFIGNTCTNDFSFPESSMPGKPANASAPTAKGVPSMAGPNKAPGDNHNGALMDGNQRKVSTDTAGDRRELDGTQSDLLKQSMIDNKLLKQLMAAIESDGPELDLNRVAGFMQRVQSGSL